MLPEDHDDIEDVVINIPPCPPQRIRVPITEHYLLEDKEDDISSHDEHLGYVNDFDDPTLIEWFDEPMIPITDTTSNSIFNHGMLLGDKYKPNYNIDSNLPLFDGSKYSTKDFCRYMLSIKENLHLGEQQFCIITGTIMSFLPAGNTLSLCLVKHSSPYKILQLYDTMADFRYITSLYVI
jgi:hypothetical protein